MRHAFLICAHNNFVLLKKLICQLDEPGFDCYVHIDQKAGFFDYKSYESITKHSHVTFLRNRLNVIWGDVSQIRVTFLLIEEALKDQQYDYLHFISGVDYPIKSNVFIKSFFEKNNGKEFVGYTPWTPVLNEKLSYYHLIPSNFLKRSRLLFRLNDLLLSIQKKFGIRHYSDTHIFSKGCNWWSITSRLAKSVVKEKTVILKQYRYTLCADEVFLQTFVKNSPDYYSRIYDKDDEYRGCLRLIDWKRGNPYTWKSHDINEILTSPAIFARKFDESDMKIIELINNEINKI
jgi:hypothetical protein